MRVGQGDLKAELVANFPPGTEAFYDWEHPDGPGPQLAACAGVLHDHGTEAVETLRRELNPISAELKLQDWERATGLRDTEVAQTGSYRARRLQIWSRLREHGATTYGMVRSVVGPLLDYTDPAQLQILEVDRDALRAAHTYTFTGPIPLPVGTSITWNVTDDAKVSMGGAQVDVTLNHPDYSVLPAALVAPDGTQQAIVPVGRGGGMTTLRLYFRNLEGAAVFGTWTLLISSPLAATLYSASLFVEGVGRDSKGNDGRGAEIFEWAAVPDTTLEGPSANEPAAQTAIVRINPATRRGVLTGPVVGPVLPLLIPDLNPRGIPNRNIPGP